MLSYKLVCLKCGREYTPFKNGVWVCEVADFGPYKIWNIDLVQCKTCENVIISGFGNNPIYYHDKDRFEHLLRIEVKFFFGYNTESIKKAEELQSKIKPISEYIEQLRKEGYD